MMLHRYVDAQRTGAQQCIEVTNLMYCNFNSFKKTSLELTART